MKIRTALVCLLAFAISPVFSQISPSTAPATQPLSTPAQSTSLSKFGRPHTPFVTVLFRDWDQLDLNKDGELSIAEINRAVLDPAIKGEDAAMVGSLKTLSRSKKVAVPRLTKVYFTQYDEVARKLFVKPTTAAAEAATTDSVASGSSPTPATTNLKIPINWDLYYLGGQKRIARGITRPTTLPASTVAVGTGLPTSLPEKFNLDNLRQGPLGDCFFVGIVGSMVVQRPGDVSKLIQPIDAHNYRITFPNGEPFTIHAPTESELAISSTSSGEGIWLAAMEQGFAEYREQSRIAALNKSKNKSGSGSEMKTTTAPATAPTAVPIVPADLVAEATDYIANGGDPGITMAMITGHKVKRIRMAITAELRQEKSAQMLPILRQELIAALKDHRLVAASVTPPLPSTRPVTQPTTQASTQPTPGPAPGHLMPVPVDQIKLPATSPSTLATTRPATRRITGHLPLIPPDINTKHLYAVLSYDPVKDTVEIWNPHGQAFVPKGPPGLRYGYPTAHGRFVLPLKEAYSFYTSFFFETDLATTQPQGASTAPAKGD